MEDIEIHFQLLVALQVRVVLDVHIKQVVVQFECVVQLLKNVEVHVNDSSSLSSFPVNKVVWLKKLHSLFAKEIYGITDLRDEKQFERLVPLLMCVKRTNPSASFK